MKGPQPNSHFTRVLHSLVEKSPGSYQQIAKATGLTAKAVAVAIVRLRGFGYAVRVNVDAAVNDIALFAVTDAGIACAEGRIEPEQEQIDARTTVERAIAKRPLLAKCWFASEGAQA